jgi:hypothetical protein
MHSLVVALMDSPVIVRVCEDIVDVNNTTFNYCAASRRTPILSDRVLLHNIFEKLD